MHHELRDGRVTLRAWRDEDLEAWAALNADPQVMRHFPHTWSRAESDASAERVRARLAEQGYGLWALQTPERPFAGFVGLALVPFDFPDDVVARLWPHARTGAPAAADPPPLHEIGWRLAREAWGRGDATTAARATLDFARHVLGLPGVVSFTATSNVASQAVMRRLDMQPAGEFDHPRLAEGHPLRRHLLFVADWR